MNRRLYLHLAVSVEVILFRARKMSRQRFTYATAAQHVLVTATAAASLGHGYHTAAVVLIKHVAGCRLIPVRAMRTQPICVIASRTWLLLF